MFIVNTLNRKHFLGSQSVNLKLVYLAIPIWLSFCYLLLPVLQTFYIVEMGIFPSHCCIVFPRSCGYSCTVNCQPKAIFHFLAVFNFYLAFLSSFNQWKVMVFLGLWAFWISSVHGLFTVFWFVFFLINCQYYNFYFSDFLF